MFKTYCAVKRETRSNDYATAYSLRWLQMITLLLHLTLYATATRSTSCTNDYATAAKQLRLKTACLFKVVRGDADIYIYIYIYIYILNHSYYITYQILHLYIYIYIYTYIIIDSERGGGRADNHRPTEGIRQKGFQPSNHQKVIFQSLISHC